MTRPAFDAGFTLVETLVAFTVVAMASIGLLLGLRTAIGASSEARLREDALQMAIFLMWEAQRGDPFSYAGEGEAPQAGMVWTREVSALASNNNVYRIVVVVPWQIRTQEGTVRLETFRRGYDESES